MQYVTRYLWIYASVLFIMKGAKNEWTKNEKRNEHNKIRNKEQEHKKSGTRKHACCSEFNTTGAEPLDP